MIVQQTNLYPVPNDSIFTFLILKYSNFYLKKIGYWLRRNEATRFNLIRDNEIQKNFVTSDFIKQLYPSVKIITTVTNPWFLVYEEYKNYKKQNLSLTMDEFIENYKPNGQNLFIEKADYIFRNEYIEEDFEPFRECLGKNTNFLIGPKFIFDSRKHFKPNQLAAIEKFYGDEIERFYKTF